MQHRRYRDRQSHKTHRGGRIMGGLLLLAIGALLLARQLFDLYFPHWLFTWPVLLIVIGFFIGAMNNFRDLGWLFISGVGAIFLMNDIWPGISIWHFIWPIGIIIAGLVLIFSPRGQSYLHWNVHMDNEKQGKDQPTGDYYAGEETATQGTSDEILDMVSVFSHNKRTVYTKNFRGGEVVLVFGGADINLMQADLKGPVTIEIVQIFGGAKLIVPPHWQVRTENTAIFGGIEDKRTPMQSYDPDKIIILKGVTIFGGIEIKSF